MPRFVKFRHILPSILDAAAYVVTIDPNRRLLECEWG